MHEYRAALAAIVFLLIAVIVVLIGLALLLHLMWDTLKEIAGDLKERDE